MERKLATVRRISKVEKHPNADSLDICTVDGWKVITKLGEFKEGDLAIYFEVDSFLPIHKEFEFLRKSCYKKLPDGSKGFRLKTIRLRGILSQGLLMPFYIITFINNNFMLLPYVDNTGYGTGEYFLYHQIDKITMDLTPGTDLTEILGVTKYEPPIPVHLAGDVKGMFPSFLRKTDEERIQNIPQILEEYKDEYVYITEKLDGTSATYYYKDGEFGACSRTLDLKEDKKNLYWKVARDYDLESKLKSLGNFCIQGEIIGPGIQGNPYKLNKPQFYAFNVFDINKQSFLSFFDYVKILYDLNLISVPILYQGKLLRKFANNIDNILKKAEGLSELNLNIQREGIVIRGMRERNDVLNTSCGRLSFKVINNKYLLGEK